MRILGRSLWDERLTLLSWSAVVVAYSAFGVSSFQSFGHNPSLTKLMAGLPPYMKAMVGELGWGTIDGYLNTEVFSFSSLILALYAGLYGAATLSGEMDSHTVEFLLAQPVRRWSVVLAKFGALALGALVLNAVLYLAILAFLGLFVKEQASTGAYALVTVSSFLTALALGAFSLLISAVVNEQRRATVFAAATVILLYFLNIIGQVSSKAGFLSDLNPFGRYRSARIILDGRLAPADVAFLVGFAVVFLAVTVLWFERKDIT